MPKLEKLRDVRHGKFMSQSDLAAKSTVSVATIVRLEAGATEARFSTVRKLAEALGVKPEELV